MIWNTRSLHDWNIGACILPAKDSLHLLFPATAMDNYSIARRLLDHKFPDRSARPSEIK